MYNKYCGQRSQTRMWGFSSAGRAPALHAGGQEFESPNLQKIEVRFIFTSIFLCREMRISEMRLAFFRSCASELSEMFTLKITKNLKNSEKRDLHENFD